jgi:hypothetical protein
MIIIIIYTRGKRNGGSWINDYYSDSSTRPRLVCMPHNNSPQYFATINSFNVICMHINYE